MVNFRKSKKFGPVRVTASTKGFGISAGSGPVRVGRGADGKVRRTVRVPGAGISDTKVIGGKQSTKKPSGTSGRESRPTGAANNSDTAIGIAIIVGVIVAIVLLINFWRQILLICGIALAVWICFVIVRKKWRSRQDRLAAERAEDERMAQRAQEQHEQYLQGEDAGIYGRFTPADPDNPKPRIRQLPRSPKEWRDEKRH